MCVFVVELVLWVLLGSTVVVVMSGVVTGSGALAFGAFDCVGGCV